MSKNSADKMLLQAGTRVVVQIRVANASEGVICEPGSVGSIAQAPSDAEHQYRVRLISGREIGLKRSEITVLGQYKSSPDRMADFDLWQHVVYKCVTGSRAYGLDHEGSDYDRRGIYLPPANMHWSLYGIPEQLENTEDEECYWEMGKFLKLALKANPNVLEVLYCPIVEHATPLVCKLLEMRHIFLSKLAYQTYNGYVLSQFKKLEANVRNHGEIRWKHAMHLIRLLLSGITILREGIVPVRVDRHRDQLLAIRDGNMSWEEINAWRLELHQQFDAAYQATSLPDRPDYVTANRFLVEARRSMVEPKHETREYDEI